MFIKKDSNYIGISKYSEEKNYKKDLDKDVKAIVKAIQGSLRFGSGTSGDRGENLGGEWLKVLTSGTANFEIGYKHTLGSQPMGYLVVYQDKAGSLYANPTDVSINTIWTSGTAYFKSNGSAVNFLVFLLERGGQ